MNTFDASYFCPFCSEQFAFCGCDQEEGDPAPFSNVCPCQDCGVGEFILFQFGGDPTQRCVFCHNDKRVVGVSTTEEDWFQGEVCPNIPGSGGTRSLRLYEGLLRFP